MTFKIFLENEEQNDIKKTISKLPNKFADLVKGYKFQFQSGNTMKGDNGHVGEVDDKKKTIIIASPWNYGREYTLLHEIAHLVWKKVSNDKRKEWSKIVKATKDRQDQPEEELFAMAFANTYAKNKIVIHTHDTWDKFVKAL